MRRSRARAGLAESPVPGNRHAGFGKRSGETGRSKDRHRAPGRLRESIGLAVQLVSPSQARNLKGRPKTDRLDAMWLARLTQWGMLRPSFVPPAAIRRVRDFTRARTDLVAERTRCLQRLEKLLEDALLTELRGEIPEFSGRAGACVARFPARDHRGRCAAGPVVVGGAAARVA